MDEKGADAVAGVKAKYDVSPDGDLFLLAQINDQLLIGELTITELGDLFLLAQIEIACPKETARLQRDWSRRLERDRDEGSRSPARESQTAIELLWDGCGC